MKNNRGFTLLEITVVTAIVILLSTTFIANYRGAEKDFSLKRSAHQLGQEIRGIQEWTLSSKRTPANLGVPTFPIGGYGIYFKINSLDPNGYDIIWFADCDNESDYDTWGSNECIGAQTGMGAGLNEKIRDISLESGVYISSLSPSIDNVLVITFFPPDPIITINGNPNISQASINLTFTGGREKTIVVYKTGLIDIE